jgi:hypothetical protein
MRVLARIFNAGQRWQKASTESLAVVALLLLSNALTGCGVIKKKPAESTDEFSVVGKPMPPEKAKAVLNEVGGNFAYGPGLGSAAVNIGTAVVFPPYIIYLVGNTALSLTGYEPVTISSVLPEDEGKAWSDGYDYVVSGPGKMVAAVAGHEYRSREVADDRLKTLLKDDSPEDARAQMKGQ